MKTEDSSKLFGTDGIRGRANQYPMCVETVVALGKAIAEVLEPFGDKKRVVIGKDTRLSSYIFENALIAGLTSMGVDTLVVGPLPTPGVAFVTRAHRANAGIVISASHNPYYDNGIKIFSSEGFKISEEVENKIESIVVFGDTKFFPDDRCLGKSHRIIDADGRYTEFAKATFPKGKTLKGLKLVLDCANGASYKVAPSVFKELDAEVIQMSCTPSGININDQCGALYPFNVQKGVIENKAHIGIALDGDGDRVIMVDEKGQIVDGDVILAICAQDFNKRKKLRNNKVVATVMTNFGVIKHLQDLGIEILFSQVGDRYVIQDMLQNQACLGGEQSGHLIFLDYNTTGDGIVSALQILRIMIETESTLSDLASCIIKTPQALINVPVIKKIPLEETKHISIVINEVKEILGTSGRILVRYSGTENVCRVMVEGLKKHLVDNLASTIACAVQKEIGL